MDSISFVSSFASFEGIPMREWREIWVNETCYFLFRQVRFLHFKLIRPELPRRLCIQLLSSSSSSLSIDWEIILSTSILSDSRILRCRRSSNSLLSWIDSCSCFCMIFTHSIMLLLLIILLLLLLLLRCLIIREPNVLNQSSEFVCFIINSIRRFFIFNLLLLLLWLQVCLCRCFMIDIVGWLFSSEIIRFRICSTRCDRKSAWSSWFESRINEFSEILREDLLV